MSAYENINKMLLDTKNKIQESEIYVGVSPKTILFTFKEKLLVLLKALILEKKIIVYSLHS